MRQLDQDMAAAVTATVDAIRDRTAQMTGDPIHNAGLAYGVAIQALAEITDDCDMKCAAFAMNQTRKAAPFDYAARADYARYAADAFRALALRHSVEEHENARRIHTARDDAAEFAAEVRNDHG